MLPHQTTVLLVAVLACSTARASIPCYGSFPVSTCEPGTWPLADTEVDESDGWWPSRSTHYGYTTGGACGFFLAPNCLSTTDTSQGDCSGVPADVINNDYAGMYAAPQGDYYAQTGDYLSCGECFEVKCIDPQCSSTKPITLQIADSCPCIANNKWCCNNYSECGELTVDSNGYKHCPLATNSLWDSKRSIHLDLCDNAMPAVSTGNISATSYPGLINTMARRVSCKATGNIWGRVGSAQVQSSCYISGLSITPDCLYYLQIGIVNVNGAGAVKTMEVYAGVVENSTYNRKWISMIREPYDTKPQETFGAWINPTGVTLYFPLQFRFTNRYGQTVTSQSWANKSAWPSGVWVDMAAQFPDIVFGSSGEVSSPCTLKSLPTGATSWNTCSTSIADGSTCKFACSSGYTAVTGKCSAGTWTTTPTCIASTTDSSGTPVATVSSGDGASCSLSKPVTATGWGNCSKTVASGSSCSFDCVVLFSEITGVCNDGSWKRKPACVLGGSSTATIPLTTLIAVLLFTTL